MALLLALMSAGLYGAADFLGGLASRSVSTLTVVAASQAAGLLALLVVLPLFPSAPTAADYAWGALAGIAGGLGVALLYRALAIGTMGVVAPTTAVCAVLIPVLSEAAAGERIGGQAMAGIAVAIVAIVLVSQSGGRPAEPAFSASPSAPDTIRPTGLGLAILSGIAIGFFFLALARTHADAGLWPLAAARAVSVGLFGTAVLTVRRPLAMGRGSLALVGACGLLDMAANACYLLATRAGALSIVVTLASLYPAGTVILARLVLRERLGPLQAVGMVSALAAVVLIVSA